MEPANLNSPSPDDQHLRTLLGQGLPPLPDDGFTQRVLAALPPPTPKRTLSFRALLCTVAAVAGLALALRRGPSLQSLSVALERLDESLVEVALPLVGDAGRHVGAGLTLALAATVLSLFYVFRESLRPTLRSIG